ncbi:MAG: nucleotide sugar dehydrogenase, partial [Candidatus Omnitrophica bacterium]|nr:nucleotide sugar dehydrogenase [Candidatus Omnitrophota bacterium]MBD3269259.1 nucleotide sugar dehydrogenase [Candidatus Omnitrophota bacterium]
MSSYDILKQKIGKKKAKICVIGLGYVGLPLAVDFLKKSFFVYGYDTNKNRIIHLFKSEKYITDIDPCIPYKFIKKNKFYPTSSARVLKDSDVLIICVPTPLRKVKTPDISYIIKASRTIKKYLRKGHLIILESTTYPGTTREVILSQLKKSGFKEGKDFFLSFSPERVDPGNKKYPLSKIPKIVGGLNKASADLTKRLYANIIEKVATVSSIEVAETAKLLENTFRMVNIGLINEFALACNKLGVSIWEVIEAAKTKPF